MRFKLLAALIVALSLAVIGYAALLRVDRSGKTPLQILVAPNDSTVTVNDLIIRGSQTIYLKPGTYTLKVTNEGFESKTSSIIVSDTPQIAVFPLLAITDSAKQKAANDATSYAKIEDAAYADSQKKGDEFREKHPITAQLPLKTMLFTIGYRIDPNDQNKIIIEVDAAKGYRNQAIQHIRKLGFNPADFNIKIRNYTNPFDGGSL